MNQGKTKSYKHLQNGSDIRGVAIIPEDFNVNSPLSRTQNLLARYGEEMLSSCSSKEETKQKTLTERAICDIAQGFYKWLSNKKGMKLFKIAIGHDSRLSAHTIKETLISSFLIKDNVIIFDAGLTSTPAMFMSTKFAEYDCDAAIMITASHLPYDRNGFKFFTREGGLNKDDISDVINLAEQNIYMPTNKSPEKGLKSEAAKVDLVQKIDLTDSYARFLRDKIKNDVANEEDYEKPLSSLHIVVDAGNGAGGFFVDKILKPLGANTEGSQFLEPDGMFPNHVPNPEDNTAMLSICNAVIANKADLGIIFDTDVDRISAVDKYGKSINRNSIIALSATLIADESPNTTIVTDSITSVHLSDFLEKTLNLKHLRYMRGYKNVINKAIELNDNEIDSQLAIETSGHAAFKENFFLDDGAYLAVKIVIKAALLAKSSLSLDVLLDTLKQAKEQEEIRFPILSEDFAACGDEVLNHLERWIIKHSEEYNISITAPNYEGVRLEFKSERIMGWALLRKSLHDPIMPLNIECDVENGLIEIKSILYKCLSVINGIDVSMLKV